MIATNAGDGAFLSPRLGPSRLDGDLVEVQLFLPREQAAALEEAAHLRGLTVGQVIRRLIHDFTCDNAQPVGGPHDPLDFQAGRWA
jgi:hypothetical protein